MRLNDTTDLALRVMIYAASVDDRLFTIDQLVETYRVPRSTVMKVVNALTKGAFLTAQRGRSGGLHLGHPAGQISVADIVRHMETDFDLVECMRSGGKCTIAPTCRLISPLLEARNAFITTLEAYSIADIAISPTDFSLTETRSR